MKNLILLFLLFPCIVSAQKQNGSIPQQQNVIAVGDTSSFGIILDSLMTILPQKSIYLRGETHAIASNNFSFYPMFKALHEQKGVNYILKEFGHSACFGYNLFLKYGDIKILADFDDILDKDVLYLNKVYRSLMSLYNYNLKQEKSKKISFIGVDFDMLSIPKIRPITQYQYVTAIRYFKKYSQKQLPEPVAVVLDEIIKEPTMDVEKLRAKDKILSKLLVTYREELKVCFGEFYKDFYIIANSAKDYPNGRRDGVMLPNLENAVKAIKEFEPSSSPKFFGSFGAAHTIPGNNGSFGSIANRSKIFKDEVSFIGLAYQNSTSSYVKDKPKAIEEAALNGLSKIQNLEINSFLTELTNQLKGSIILLGRFKDLPKDQLSFLKPYDALFLFNGF